MLFPTHLVVAIGLGRGRFPTAWLVAGAALPDLIDKPLAMAGIIPTYHSIAHSAFFGFGFLVMLLLARRRGVASKTKRVVAMTLGWGSHLVADAAHISLNGRPANTVFLSWPVVTSWDSLDSGPVPFVVQYIGTTSFYVEIVIWLVVGTAILNSDVSAQNRDE